MTRDEFKSKIDDSVVFRGELLESIKSDGSLRITVSLMTRIGMTKITVEADRWDQLYHALPDFIKKKEVVHNG